MEAIEIGIRNRLDQLSHLPRYKEIANILIKHGFGSVFDRFAWHRIKSNKANELLGAELGSNHIARRLREALEELGPTFVKLGQILSTRPDLLPPEYIIELEKLQNEVPPFSYETLLEILKREGVDLQRDFAYFNPEPLAAASIAQVHEAVLKNGQKVVLKVKRPDIDKSMENDLEILVELSYLLERRNNWAKMYRISEIIIELGQALRNELDFRKEARNADIFYRNFQGDGNVIIPRVIWEYSSAGILVLEYVEGVKISDFISLKKGNYDTRKIAGHLVEALFKQIYEHGFLHADPHPGNIAIAAGEKIIFYDFGQVGVVDQIIKDKGINLMVNMMRYDTNGVSRSLLDIGIGSQYVNQEELRRDVSRLQQKYYGLPLSEINVGEALRELIDLSMKYQMRLPAELSLMVKMLMTVENLISQLDPQLSIVDIAEPYGKKLMMKRFLPENLKKETGEFILDYVRLLRAFPREVDNMLRIIEAGELRIKMEHGNLKPLIARADIISNRISLAIILASIIVGTSLLARQSSDGFLSSIPLVDVGFALAMILGLFMVYSIIRSGHY
ncbi:MAG: AarF/ABC1/UbiB kinase family protein [Syntrophomonadaceae bacterium]|nr:AarF/ABC1/UbiB kinase family protein [Syntrophomonadaceae bacterium]